MLRAPARGVDWTSSDSIRGHVVTLMTSVFCCRTVPVRGHASLIPWCRVLGTLGTHSENQETAVFYQPDGSLPR